MEDDLDLLKLYAEKLTASKFEVVQAWSGKQALMELSDKKPDLILLDIMLPGGLNGFDVLEKIKVNDELKKIPVFIMTNLDNQEEVAKKVGAEGYFVKVNTNLEEMVKRIKSRV